MVFGFFKRRTLLITVFGYKKYLEIAARLTSSGIAFRTKSADNNFPGGSHSTFSRSYRDDIIQYDIYVKEEDVHIAQQAISRKL